MKQKKISYWLKGLVIILMLLGIVFWGGVIYLSVSFRKMLDVAQDWKYFLSIGQHTYVAAFYFAILVQFWKVCTEIGRDNSFSLENVKSFHLMSIFGGAEAIGFAARIVGNLVLGEVESGFLIIAFTGAELFVAVVFLILCECLSQLIENAYEVKRENELTI